jgi:tetratricopeptide (TPR) repeat protein
MGEGRRKKKTVNPVAAPKPAQRSARAPSVSKSATVSSEATHRLFDIRLLSYGVLLALASIVTFGAVRQHDFVYYDDPKYVTENPVVLGGLTSRGIAWALTTGTDANWFPLTWMSHMLDVQLHGVTAGGHHETSLIIHIINTLLLLGVLTWMTKAPGRSAFVAGLFSLHPLHVESVAWVAERKDVLSTLFWMLTTGAYVWYTRSPKLSRYVVTLIFFAAGLMSKPMLVTLPFVLLILDWWPLNRVRTESFWHLTKEKIPMLALAGVSSVITFMVQRQGGAVGGLEAFPFVLRVQNALVSYVSYVGKTLWPAKLAAFYPYPDMMSGAQALGALVILIGASFLAYRYARRFPYLPVGWLWYLGTLVPVIGLIQVGNQAMADRYTYVPLIGLFIIVAWGTADLLQRFSYQRFILPALAVIVLAGCAVTSRRQVESWQDSKALWTHALAVTSENYLAHNNLGLALQREGKTDEAMSHYDEALRIRPGYATARTNLGVALSKQGKTADAIATYAEALRHNPGLAKAHADMGAALAAQGRVDEAIAEYNEALRLKPGHPESHANLGLALASKGKLDDAIVHYREALKLKPGYFEVENNLGYALAVRGRFDEAIVHYNEAIRLSPGFELARVNLAVALANLKKTEEALEAFFDVLRINPDNEMALASVAALNEERKKAAEAKAR